MVSGACSTSMKYLYLRLFCHTHHLRVLSPLATGFGRRLAVVLPALCLMACLSTAKADQPTAPAPDNNSHIKGMWVWHSQFIFDPAQRQDMLAFCDRQGINLLLVQVHYDKQADPIVIKNPQAYIDLVQEAHERRIRIEALDGEKSMAQSHNQPKTFAILHAILDLHAQMPKGKGFAGVHYDIEPYILDEWSDPAQRTVILQDLLTYYDKAKQVIREADPELTLACDIPFWFDTQKTEDGLPMAVEYAGTTKPAQQHIQDICDYIGIMSYRRDAVGPNSITGVVQDELAYAKRIGKGVCASVETVPYPEVPTISFHGQPASLFNERFAQAWQTLEPEPGFAGMLIHCYPNVRELIEPDAD